MHGLMDIGDEVDQKLKGFNAIGWRLILIGQNSLKDFNSIDDAIVVVFYRRCVFFIRPEAVSRLRETAGFHWNVHKVPSESFRALCTNFIRPG